MIVFNGVELIIYCVMIAMAIICFFIAIIQTFASKIKKRIDDVYVNKKGADDENVDVL